MNLPTPPSAYQERLQEIRERAQKSLENHVCVFSDGGQKCGCFIAGFSSLLDLAEWSIRAKELLDELPNTIRGGMSGYKGEASRVVHQLTSDIVASFPNPQ